MSWSTDGVAFGLTVSRPLSVADLAAEISAADWVGFDQSLLATMIVSAFPAVTTIIAMRKRLTWTLRLYQPLALAIAASYQSAIFAFSFSGSPAADLNSGSRAWLRTVLFLIVSEVAMGSWSAVANRSDGIYEGIGPSAG